MNQRDDASEAEEQDEETDTPDAADTGRSADTGAGDESDGEHTSDGSDVSEDEGGSDGPGTEDGNGQETSEGADGEAEETKGTENVEETEETEETEDVEEAGEAEDTEETGEPEDAEESDPVAISETGGDGSASIGDEPTGGVVESEIGETESAEGEAPSSAPTKGPDEVYCQSCGEPIKAEAEVCPNCGVRQQGSPGEEKSSAVSFIASLIIPGAGQAYNEQIGRAIAMFFGAVVADTIIVLLAIILTFILIGPLFLLLIPVVHVAIAYDAYNQAEKINRGEITV
jgi:TM2 domain-containing membrane protein YozV